MTTAQMLQCLRDEYPELLLADGFDDAIIGIVDGSGRNLPVVCYDYQRCVRVLMRDSDMDEETACEYLDFNTLGAYVGEHTPMFLHDWRNVDPWYEVDLDEEEDQEKKETRSED